MKLLPLTASRAQIRCDVPLPWNVRDAHGQLLLAKGHILTSSAMVDALLERGAFVDADEVRGRAEASGRSADSIFERWAALEDRLSALLRNPKESDFLSRIQEIISAVNHLVDRHTDPLIFAIMRHDYRASYATYGVAHSLHVATVSALLALRMEMPAARRASLVGAALTMNLSMVELQGILASRGGRLDALQAQAVQAHPGDSVNSLKALGVADVDWLMAVQNHHEAPGGTGYPNQADNPDELSQILRLVDIFTAKHAVRAGRASVPPRQAAQELYLQNKDQPAAALLIKEFGLYPPGCFVKLANGETAVVTRVGGVAHAPQVAVVLNRNGDVMGEPIRRDTAVPDYAVKATLQDSNVLVTVNAEQLYGRIEA